MPAYSYNCTKCNWFGTRYNVKIAERDEQSCECGAKLNRGPIDELRKFSPDYGFQMQAVTDKGHVPGHFGKDAPKRRRWL